MKKINFENAEIINPAKVTIEGIDYEVTPAQLTVIEKYLSAETLNEMQSNIEESCVAVSPTQPETNEKVWIQKGKNLFNLLCMLTSSSNSTASLVEKTTNSVILKGSASTYQYLTLKKDLKAGTYAFKRKWKVISGISNGNTGAVIISKDTDNSTLLVLNQSTSEGIFTITEDTTIKIVLYLSIDNALVEETQTEFYEIQLEQGSTATEYEEYIDRKIIVENNEFLNVETMGIEKITNENGTAIKFPDGTLIQRGKAYCNENGAAVISFPVQFINADDINMTANSVYVGSGGLGIITTTQSDTTSVGVIYFRNYVNGVLTLVTDTSVAANWIAIGRWK